MDINRIGTTPAATPPTVRSIAPESAPPVALAPVHKEAPVKEPSDKQLDEAIQTANKFLATTTNSIEFSIDKDSGRTIVKLVDSQTQEVVRQFPSNEMLAIAKDMSRFQGLFISAKS
jgi:flagellar protein FlaG